MRRKSYTNTFKLKVAIKGDMTIAEIVSRYQVAPTQVHKWKKQLYDKGHQIFSQTNIVEVSASKQISKLHEAIGR